MSGDCSYTFDPEASDRTTVSERWTCPHEPYRDTAYCVFHSTQSDQEVQPSTKEIQTTFLNGLQSRDPRRSQFIGISVETLDLSEADLHVAGADSIDLRHASLDVLDLTSARVSDVLRCDDSEIGVVHAEVCEFLDRVRLCGCQIELAMFQLATFERYANFNESVFNETYFSSAFFNRVRFNETQFTDTASFHNTKFKEWTDFGDAKFHDSAIFSQARFDDDITFTRAAFTGDQCTFRGCRFRRKVAFEHVQFTTSPDFAEIDCTGSHHFQLHAPTDDIIVSFRDANLKQGAIGLIIGEKQDDTDDWEYEPAGEIAVDFTDASLGDVDLHNQIIHEEIEETGESTSYLATVLSTAVDFDTICLRRTTFDGFDFSKHHTSLLESNWNIHHFNTPDVDPPMSLQFTKELTPTDLEETYLKAKNGARAAGDNRAASEFFLREMRQRRAQHYATVHSDRSPLRRLKGFLSTAANDLLYVTAGYGERPSRVIGISFGIILIGTLLFQGLLESYRAPPNIWIESFLFSFQSFITFIIGSPPAGSESTIIRMLSALEGFLGAFLVALFVFTLTRSVHR